MLAVRSPLLQQRKMFLAVADLTYLACATLGAVVLVLGWEEARRYVLERLPSFLILLVLAPPIFYLCGLYSTSRLRRVTHSLIPIVAAVTILLLLGSAAWYLTWSPEIGRKIFVQLGLLCIAGLLLLRYVYAGTRTMLDVRTVVVGSARLSSDVAGLLWRYPDAPLKVLGLVLCPEERHGKDSAPPETLPAFPVIGRLGDLDELVAMNRVDRIILPARLREYPALLRHVRPLSYRGVTLVDFVSLYEELAQEIPLDRIDDDWLFAAASSPSQLHIRRLKRLTDVFASFVLLAAASPVLLLATLAVKLTSRGPVLFEQERVGLSGRPFTVLKLRTMREDAEKLTGPVWSSENDPRITPVGRYLRKFRIDELPQLWNVLRGDMSLVGPRPERPVFVQKLSDAIPHYAERLLVRPGITGWAQVKAPYAASVSDSARKLQFDLYYTKNLSFSLDLFIFLLTARTVLFGREREQGGIVAGRQMTTNPMFQALDLAAANGEAKAHWTSDRAKGRGGRDAERPQGANPRINGARA
jgi:exopolysaccharide biosynthesis polyprenyl glycosylphosphotransferase